jgi:intracellular septation protein
LSERADLLSSRRRRTKHADRSYPDHVKQFAEFVPVLIFVVVYYVANQLDGSFALFYATAALMIAVTLQMLAMRLRKRPISQQLKITFWISIVLGGLTLAFQDKTFILWKPTIVNWVLAIALIASQYIGRRNLLERALGGQLKLPSAVWRRLNYGWAGAFVLSGALNLFVAYRFSEAFWVNYKLIGGIGLTFLYVATTIFYLHRGGYLASHDTQPAEPPP